MGFFSFGSRGVGTTRPRAGRPAMSSPVPSGIAPAGGDAKRRALHRRSGRPAGLHGVLTPREQEPVNPPARRAGVRNVRALLHTTSQALSKLRDAKWPKRSQ